jgi:hypothetical protein
MRGVWKRRGRAFVPLSEAAMETLASIKDGASCVGEFRGARHPKQLALYWALMGVLVDHGVFPMKEAASDAVKIGCGHAATVIMPDTGEVYFVPKSIAFESMAQTDFSAFLNAAIDLICERWLAGADRQQLRERVFEIVDGPTAIGSRVTPDALSRESGRAA